MWAFAFPRPTWSASTSCCPTSPTCASAPPRSRRSSSRTATRTIWAPCRGCCGSWAPGTRRRFTAARCRGRIVVTSFASNIHRVQQVMDAAAELDRKVVLVGRSMRKNVGIGRALGHIEVADGQLVGTREVEDLPDERIVVISTGSQGEPLSALRRMAYRDHPLIEPREGDTVVFSATPIPGNERAVNDTIDRLYHIGCEVITPREAPVHASGHGYAEEIKLMLNLLKPRYVMPF